jgi:lysophospholipase L1-like esterase
VRLAAFAAASALGAYLTGCGGGATTAGGSAQTFAAASPKISAVTNFGASITCGYYATQQGASGNVYSQLGYAGRFDTALGVPAQDLCRAGDQAADTVRTWVLPNASPALGARQLYTLMVGTNDAQFCGASDACIANWRSSITATLTWLALPSGDKILGFSLLDSASPWSADLDFGIATSAPAASLTFPVTQAVAGRTLYIAYRVFDSGIVTGGSATVQVDGVSVAVLRTIVDTGHAIHTKNGLTDTVFVAAVRLGAAGAHTVKLTTGASGGFFSFQWAGVSSGNYATLAGAPRVMVATLPASTDATLNSALQIYNTALSDLVPTLVADRMYITLVPCGAALDATTDYYDNVHPNDSGHQKLAATFKSAL